jgi:DUF4097 and DUF4098 domain-containing protein YvlB
MSRARLSSLLVLLGALTACHIDSVEEVELQEFRFESLADRPVVEVRIEDGHVEIQGIEGSRSIEARFEKRARSVDSETASRLLDRIEVSAVEAESGARFRLEGRAESVPTFGGSLRTDLILRVPRQVVLEIETRDGRIEIEGVEGRVRAESGDGRIVVERSSGELRLRTEDGSIVGRNLDARVEAATEDGSLELEGTFARLEATTSDGGIEIDCVEWRESTEDWMVRTGDGAIRVSLPREASAEIDARVSDGRIVSRIPDLPVDRDQEEDRDRLRGTLGRGGPRLVFFTNDGSIELDQK